MLYEDNIEGRLLDGLLPFSEKYLGNSYIDVYNYFCRPVNTTSTVSQLYSTGLELQQKLDKIIDYDKCNPDMAKSVGLAQYCKDLFKEQVFFFWSNNQLTSYCDGIDTVFQASKVKDECAVLNDHIYGKYHEQQQIVLTQVQELTKKLVAKKSDKLKKLQEFVSLQTDDQKEGSPDNSTDGEMVKVSAKNMSLSVHKDICNFIAQFSDGNDLNITKVCDKNFTDMFSKQEKLRTYLGSLSQEYKECEDNKKCMDKMSKEMKDNSAHIRKYMAKLKKIDKIGAEEAANREEAHKLAR